MESGKQHVNQPHLLESLMKEPYCLGTNHAIFELQSQKADEGKPDPYLVFDPLIRQVVQLLQRQQQREHHRHINRTHASVALTLFLMHTIQITPERILVDFCIQSKQGVSHLLKLDCAFRYVKKFGLPLACHCPAWCSIISSVQSISGLLLLVEFIKNARDF